MSRLGGPLLDRLLIAPEVSAALRAGAPVVALESTLITHGLPHPLNFEVARAAEHAVRVEGAVPATVAIRDGRLMVGLSEEELVALASAMVDTLGKAARPNLAAALAAPGWAGATVSATMIAAHVAGITVFATGGIGGVHHGALAGRAPTFDISPDTTWTSHWERGSSCASPSPSRRLSPRKSPNPQSSVPLPRRKARGSPGRGSRPGFSRASPSSRREPPSARTGR